jgi:Na+/proline symporter
MVMNLSMLFVNIGLFIIILPILDWIKKRNTDQRTTQAHSLGFLSIAATLIATELGASLLLSSSQESLYTACWGLFYIVGISIGYLILGGGLAAHMRAVQCNNSAQYLEYKYQSPGLKKLSYILSMLIMYAFLVGELVATKSFFHGLGLTNELTFISLWFLLVLYCAVGGLSRLGISTFAQLSFFAVIFSSIFLYCLTKQPLTYNALTFFVSTQNLASFSQINIFSLVLSLVSIISYCISEQDVTHPLFLKKSRIMELITSAGAGIFMILFSLMTVYFCYQAQLLELEIPLGLSPIIPVIKYFTNDIMVTCMLCGIIIAIIATFDYLFLAISSYWIDDFNIFTDNQSKALLTVANGTLVIVISYLFSTDLLSVFNKSFELYTCLLLVPLLFAYLKKEVKSSAAWYAVAGGLLSFCLSFVINFSIENEIVHCACSLVGYLVGSLRFDMKFAKKLRPILIKN